MWKVSEKPNVSNVADLQGQGRNIYLQLAEKLMCFRKEMESVDEDDFHFFTGQRSYPI